ncbi:MAG TPA: DUF4389 domain-containing protein [Solirubrobacterales bacterium]|nr:DUF4389 domain-containing protein [Solirubrobacterales bacterium]
MYPVAYEADFNPEPNRWTTFFRLILAIPWLIVAYVYLIAAFFTHIFAWVAVVILGRYPEWLYNFNSGVIRYLIRVYAWAYLQTDAWPPFGLAEDPAYPIRVKVAPAAERQSRLTAFFRIFLILPMLVVSYAVNYVHLWVAVIAWLTIVFRGYLPEGINNALTFVNSFYARVYGYFALLTDDYPPIGIERARPSGVGPNAATQPSPPASAA